VKKGDGRVALRVLLPLYVTSTRFILLSTTFYIQFYRIVCLSAFSTPNNAVRFTDLRFKTSVASRILQYVAITQNSLKHSHEIELFVTEIIAMHLSVTPEIIRHIKLNTLVACKSFSLIVVYTVVQSRSRGTPVLNLKLGKD